MLRRCDEVNSKSLQVVVGVCEGDDFRLAAVARSGIDLPDVQRLPDQGANLLCCLRQGRLVLDNFGPTLDVPAAHQRFLADATTVDSSRGQECATAGGDAAGAANTLAVVKNQMCSPGGFVYSQCRCRTCGYHATRNLAGKQVRLEIGRESCR